MDDLDNIIGLIVLFRHSMINPVAATNYVRKRYCKNNEYKKCCTNVLESFLEFRSGSVIVYNETECKVIAAINSLRSYAPALFDNTIAAVEFTRSYDVNLLYPKQPECINAIPVYVLDIVRWFTDLVHDARRVYVIGTNVITPKKTHLDMIDVDLAMFTVNANYTFDHDYCTKRSIISEYNRVCFITSRNTHDVTKWLSAQRADYKIINSFTGMRMRILNESSLSIMNYDHSLPNPYIVDRDVILENTLHPELYCLDFSVFYKIIDLNRYVDDEHYSHTNACIVKRKSGVYMKQTPQEANGAEIVYTISTDTFAAAKPVFRGVACAIEYVIDGSIPVTVLWKSRCSVYNDPNTPQFVDESNLGYKSTKLHRAPMDIVSNTFVSNTFYNKTGNTGLLELYHGNFKKPVGYVITTDVDIDAVFIDENIDARVKLMIAMLTS